jgi:hypothetical protein
MFRRSECFDRSPKHMLVQVPISASCLIYPHLATLRCSASHICHCLNQTLKTSPHLTCIEMAIQSAADNRRVWYTQWVEKELIPLLMNAYGYPAKYWRQAAKNAEQNLDALVSILGSCARQSQRIC